MPLPGAAQTPMYADHPGAGCGDSDHIWVYSVANFVDGVFVVKALMFSPKVQAK
jgi:hypothetical protein